MQEVGLLVPAWRSSLPAIAGQSASALALPMSTQLIRTGPSARSCNTSWITLRPQIRNVM